VTNDIQDLEKLIKQVFLNIDMTESYYVQQGYYDILSPDGEIVLPQVWETVAQPGWTISMQIRPMRSSLLPSSKPRASIVACLSFFMISCLPVILCYVYYTGLGTQGILPRYLTMLIPWRSA